MRSTTQRSKTSASWDAALGQAPKANPAFLAALVIGPLGPLANLRGPAARRSSSAGARSSRAAASRIRPGLRAGGWRLSRARGAAASRRGPNRRRQQSKDGAKPPRRRRRRSLLPRAAALNRARRLRSALARGSQRRTASRKASLAPPKTADRPPLPFRSPALRTGWAPAAEKPAFPGLWPRSASVARACGAGQERSLQGLPLGRQGGRGRRESLGYGESFAALLRRAASTGRL
jgi:hypothetical protein